MFAAFVPIIVMYTIWIYGTATGKISTPLEISKKRHSDDAGALEPILNSSIDDA
jgi:hypothetical protein